jgi:hypothetical protein
MSQFPIFRKLINNKSFYKIISSTKFEEKRLIGSRLIIETYTASQYPEMLLIQDMINKTHAYYLDSNLEEFESVN